MWITLLSCALLGQADGRVALEQAEAAYAGGRYERVLPLLEQALSSELPNESKVRAYALRAVTHAAFGESNLAVQAYGRAMAIDPTFDPGSRVSPKVRGLYEEARRALPPSERSAPFLPTKDPAPAPAAPLAWYARPWIWMVAGAVVLGAGASSYVLLQPRIPAGNLPAGVMQ